jgi:LysR family cys regulon transcriptional activator
VSKAILELEQELGVDIFARHGKRIKHITEPGQHVLKSIEAILLEVNNLKRIGEHFAHQDQGTLSIATTHTQARYVLPAPVSQLRQEFPDVKISLHQGSPAQVAQMLMDDVADIGVATESLNDFPNLVTLPCYEWQHLLVLPMGHRLLDHERITLSDLAQEPIITYHPSFTGRTRIDQAFAQRKLQPNIVLEAIDSDVIKTYVGLGMGVGIVAEMAMQNPDPNGTLVSQPAGHLFGRNLARVAFKRGTYLRPFVLRFAELLSDRLSAALIQKTMNGTPDNYSL